MLYGLGFGLAGIYYLIFGHSYIHAPGLHHFILLLTYLIGIAWTLAEIYNYLFESKKRNKLKVIFVNLLFIIPIVIYITYNFIKYS